jgi:hypothetical protein
MNFMLRTRNTGQINIDRIFARLFVFFGGIFWIAAFFGGTTAANYRNAQYSLPELAKASTTSLIPLALTIGVIVLGLFYERLTGILLAVTALLMLVWGFTQHWGEVWLWVTAVSVLVAPSAIASALYELAARRQEAQELSATREQRNRRLAPEDTVDA